MQKVVGGFGFLEHVLEQGSRRLLDSPQANPLFQ